MCVCGDSTMEIADIRRNKSGKELVVEMPNKYPHTHEEPNEDIDHARTERESEEFIS